MQKRYFLFIILVASYFSFINTGCTKITSTTLGSDLLPAVDNIHTFDTFLTVNATQGIFNDSTRMAAGDNAVLGSINNDPLFGKTNANVYLQLKPSFFPFYFGDPSGDTLNGFGAGLDSAVLCLSLRGFYGDTSIAQHFIVYEIPQSADNFSDSSYLLNYHPALGNQIGEATVDVRTLGSYIYYPGKTDSVNNQIRIKLSDAFANTLYGRDTFSAGNKAFLSDSLFKTFYKGFAVVADPTAGGNGLFYVNFTDPSTRLEVYYRKRRANVIDTTLVAFGFSTDTTSTAVVSASAHANYLNRDISGSEFANAQDPDALYIQSTPGSYVNLTIPDLSSLSNRVINRAEIDIEQIPDNPLIDGALPSFNYLYADLIDTAGKFKPIYYDLSPYVAYDPDNSVSFFPYSGIDQTYFGGTVRQKLDSSGNNVSYFSLDISRYVQHIVTNHAVNYPIRLYAPSVLNYYGVSQAFSNSLAYGRLKIGGPNSLHHRLRFRIIYSKL